MPRKFTGSPGIACGKDGNELCSSHLQTQDEEVPCQTTLLAVGQQVAEMLHLALLRGHLLEQGFILLFITAKQGRVVLAVAPTDHIFLETP